MKNKTLAAWLAFLTGVFGGHRFYLYGFGDSLAWFLPIPTALGLYGMERVQSLGQDDQLSWLLIPLLGFTFAACALTAIVYGLMDKDKWNRRFNQGQDSTAGQTNWLTIGAVVLSLLVGATVLMSSIVFSFQRYFEHQISEAQKLSQ